MGKFLTLLTFLTVFSSVSAEAARDGHGDAGPPCVISTTQIP